MGEVIVITSGKGGVGKTTTTANIGAGLAALNKKVVLVDTDIGLRNLDLIIGLENRVVYNLIDVVEDKCELKDALIEDRKHPGMFLLSAAQNRDKTALTPGQMRKITEELRKDFDYVLLDCPAGIELGFQNAIAGADRAIIVTNPENPAIRDADRIVGLLASHGLPEAELIVNRIRPALIASKDMMTPQEIAEMMPVTLLGAVPDDDGVIIASNKGTPVVGNGSPAGLAYQNICRRIMGDSVELPVYDEQGNQIFAPSQPEETTTTQEPPKKEKRRGLFRRRKRT